MLLFLAKKLVIFDVADFAVIFAFFPFPRLSHLAPSAMNSCVAVACCISKYLSEYSGNFFMLESSFQCIPCLRDITDFGIENQRGVDLILNAISFS